MLYVPSGYQQIPRVFWGHASSLEKVGNGGKFGRQVIITSRGSCRHLHHTLPLLSHDQHTCRYRLSWTRDYRCVALALPVRQDSYYSLSFSVGPEPAACAICLTSLPLQNPVAFLCVESGDADQDDSCD